MKQVKMTPQLYKYMLDVSLREHPVLHALRAHTAHLSLAHMQIPPEQAQFMQFLLKLTHAKKVLEIGTFTGYSALAMALALPDDGRLITCDHSIEWTQHAHDFWEKAHQTHKIELRLAPAKQTLNELIAQDQHFDFIFIDADKTNYLYYYESALQLITPDGFIAIDNVLWNGDVINEEVQNAQTRDIRKLNQLIQQDPRVDISLLPVADGLFLVKLAD